MKKGFELKQESGTVFLQLPHLRGLKHAFGTRQERDGVAAAFGLSSQQLLTLKQVHGAQVLVVKENPDTLPRPLSYDAAITQREGVALGVWTADCVPILMVDPSNGAIGAVHAGWRGLSHGIVERTISKMGEFFSSPPGNILVGIGPGIGPCCYQVGEDVVNLFQSSRDDSHLFIKEREGRSFLDLGFASRLQLLKAGVPRGNIEAIPLCTACREDLFFSYRRDGKTGRQLSFVMLE